MATDKAKFRIVGPMEINVKQKKHGRCIQEKEFWEESKKKKGYANLKGVYVYGIRPSGTDRIKPYYVGKAEKSFKSEVFKPYQKGKYNEAFMDFKSCTPNLFLIINKGKANKKQIREIEKYFINLGSLINRDILNYQHAGLPQWSITGLVRSKAKKLSKDTRQFAQMFGMEKRLEEIVKKVL